MTLWLLIFAPLFLIAPGVFQDRSSIPKMLSIAAGLCFLVPGGLQRKAAAHNQALAFLGVCCLSLIFSADKWVSFAGLPRAPYYGVFGVSLVVLAYLGSTELDPDDVDEFLIAGGAGLGGFAIMQRIAGTSLTGMVLPIGRAVGFRGSPIMMAASLIPCFLAAYHRIRRNWAFRKTGPEAIALWLIGGGILAAKSKGALLALAAGIWVYEVPGFWRWFGLLMGVAVAHGQVQRSPEERERAELLRIAWKSFKQHPYLGWGPDCFFHALMANRPAADDTIWGDGNAQASAHQDLAQVASTLGIAGLFAYLAGIGRLLKASYSDAMAPALLCAMIVQAQVNPIPTDILVTVAVVLASRQRDSEGLAVIPSWVAPAVMAAAVVLAMNNLTPAARGAFHAR